MSVPDYHPDRNSRVLRRPWKYCEIPIRHFPRRVFLFLQAIEKFQYVGAAKLQDMLMRLVFRAGRIIDIRRRRLFYVASENVSHGLAFGKADQALSAGEVGGEIADVEAAGIKMVPGQQDAGAAVVIRDMRRVVAWDRKHVDDAVTKVDTTDVLRPVRDTESFPSPFDS